MTPRLDAARMQQRIDDHPFWYHTIDVAPGVTTKGWFDLRGIVDLLPWPNVVGKRCLDIGTLDGYFAFELERRGAREVVALDVEDHLLRDRPHDHRAAGLDSEAGSGGPPEGEGLRLVAALTGSQVQWRSISIDDLSPELVGTFDVVVCGSLLLHLRDPIRALEAVRSVCSGVFLSSEQIDLWLSIVGRGRPLYTLNSSARDCRWWNANAAGHKQMVHAAGFAVERTSRPYVVRSNHHPRVLPTLRNLPTRVATRVVTGRAEQGLLHRAVLARPRV